MNYFGIGHPFQRLIRGDLRPPPLILGLMTAAHDSTFVGRGRKSILSSVLATRTSPSPVSTRNNATTYECSVCLEKLDAPASVEERVDPDIIFLGMCNKNWKQIDVPLEQNDTRLTEAVATLCGHMYHKVCLDRWFTEQGRRSCPTCRHIVPPEDVIRLVPTCKNTLCVKRKVKYNSLMNGYSELKDRFHNLQMADEQKDARVTELEESNNRLLGENQLLKRQVEEAPTPAIKTKRRRRR